MYVTDQEGHVLAKNYENPEGPIYVISGGAGNVEGHDAFPSPLLPSSAYVDVTNFGLSTLQFFNATHLQFQYLRADDGSLSDEFWVIQS